MDIEMPEAHGAQIEQSERIPYLRLSLFPWGAIPAFLFGWQLSSTLILKIVFDETTLVLIESSARAVVAPVF